MRVENASSARAACRTSAESKGPSPRCKAKESRPSPGAMPTTHGSHDPEQLVHHLSREPWMPSKGARPLKDPQTIEPAKPVALSIGGSHVATSLGGRSQSCLPKLVQAFLDKGSVPLSDFQLKNPDLLGIFGIHPR